MALRADRVDMAPSATWLAERRQALSPVFGSLAAAAHAGGLPKDDGPTLDASIDTLDGGSLVLAFAAARMDRPVQPRRRC